jgi:large subunit ribosomal protein L10
MLMAKLKSKKESELASVVEKLSRAKGVAVAAYAGLTVKATEELRHTLKESNAELLVVKKTLLGLALDQSKQPRSLSELDGSLMVAFSYGDEVTAAKVLAEFIKKNAEVLSLVGGIADGALLDKAGIKTLATLPSRLELLAKMVGSLQSPLSGLVGVMHGTLSKFVRTLDAVRAAKA